MRPQAGWPGQARPRQVSGESILMKQTLEKIAQENDALRARVRLLTIGSCDSRRVDRRRAVFFLK